MIRSLNSKIVATTTLVVVISITLSVYLSGRLLANNYKESVAKELQTAAASLLSLGISDFSELSDFDSMNSFIEESLKLERADKIVRIFGKDRKIIYTTLHAPHDPFPKSIDETIADPTFLTLLSGGNKYESLIVPYDVGKKHYYLQIIIPLARVREIMTSFGWQSLVLMTGLLILSIILSKLLTQRLLRPVSLISNYLSTLDTREILHWPPLPLRADGVYLEPIIKGINGLVDQTQNLVLKLQKMSRFVAHELRTPLTILQGEAETILLKQDPKKEELILVLKSSLEETNRMTEIVSTVLQVGELQKTSHLLPKEVPFRDWFISNLPLWEKTLGRSIHCNKSDLPEMVKMVEPQLLFRLIDNLVRNIKDHVRSNPECTLEIKQNDGKCLLTIIDNGPGLEPKILQAINNRKEQEELEGVGLFLCRQISDLCGYDLHFSNCLEGGLCIEIGI